MFKNDNYVKAKRLQLHKERQKEMDSRLFKVRLLLRNLNVRHWTNQLIGASVVFFFSAGLLMQISREGSPLYILAISFVFCAIFLMGCVGFLWFYRKEMYYKGSTTKGKWAQFNGMFLWLGSWSLILIFLFQNRVR